MARGVVIRASSETYIPLRCLEADTNVRVLTNATSLFQHILVSTTCIIIDPITVSGLICADNESQVRVRLIATVLFMSGIATLLQTTIGTR